MWRSFFAVIGLSWALLAGTVGCTDSGEPGGYAIAVIPKGESHEFWQSVHAGAKKAERELEAEGVRVRVIWGGPDVEGDVSGQKQIVERRLAAGVAAIVLAPLHDEAMVDKVEEATNAGVPVVIIDSDVKTDKRIAYIATDNHRGGYLAGQKLAELLDGNGRVMMLRYMENSASTEQREAGFLEAIARHPGITVVSSNQYGQDTAATAQAAAATLITRFTQDGSLQVDGIFTPNESTTQGMLNALTGAGFVGRVRFVGFDASRPLVAAMREGHIDALTVQNPMRMGYEGVRTAVAHLQGKPVADVDTGVVVITRQTMDGDEAKALLNPPLDQYLR
jgi:ribose transport system substrate-binding protein